MNKKASGRASVFAAILIVLCIAILAGSTYAWFTDRAEVTVNRIVAGTLDVGMQYTNNALGGTWEDVESIAAGEYAPFFVDADGQPINWEPGVVSYANFRIVNVGDRALKYELSTFAAHCNTALDEAGDDTGKSLADVVRVGTVTYTDESEVKLYDERDTLLSSVDTWKHLDEVSNENICLLAGEADYITLVLYWEPTDSDNDYNLKNGKPSSDGEPLFLDADITLVATQAVYEKDSFDDQYDESADYAFSGNSDSAGLENNTDTAAMTVEIASAEQLLAFAKAVNSGNTYAGYTVTLTSDVGLGGYDWQPIGTDTDTNVFAGSFDGKGHTVRGLTVDVTENAGLFGCVIGDIANVNVDGAYIKSQSRAGGIVALAYGDVTGCSVTNTTVEAVDESGQNGGKAGSIVGESGDGVFAITGNTAKNVRLTANRDCGVIAGCVSADTSAAMTDNTVDNVGVKWSGYGTEDENIGPNPENAHVGRIA